jgi:hypothetical protein
LPSKPQSIIIEKWLPYKPAPPREVIYEHVIETPIISQFQPNGRPANGQPCESTECLLRRNLHSPIPQSSAFEKFTQSTQHHIEMLQRITTEHIETQQYHMNNQWQQQPFMFTPWLSSVTTPTVIVNHPPITRTIDAHVQAQNNQHIFFEPFYTYPFYQ